MKITIANILKSDLAIYHDEGLIVYAKLQTAYDNKESIELSFVGLSRCSTQFLNASVGKLYLLNDPKMVDCMLTFEYGEHAIVEAKIKEVRENAINSKEYDALVANA